MKMKNVKSGKRMAWVVVAVSCIIFFGANAQFIYLASTTQPECVAHKKTGSNPDKGFAAAKSSC